MECLFFFLLNLRVPMFRVTAYSCSQWSVWWRRPWWKMHHWAAFSAWFAYASAQQQSHLFIMSFSDYSPHLRPRWELSMDKRAYCVWASPIKISMHAADYREKWMCRLILYQNCFDEAVLIPAQIAFILIVRTIVLFLLPLQSDHRQP